MNYLFFSFLLKPIYFKKKLYVTTANKNQTPFSKCTLIHDATKKQNMSVHESHKIASLVTSMHITLREAPRDV